MTRINSAIDPKNLIDQHLIAELRELPRIFTAVNKRILTNKSFNDIPIDFRLGIGHCKFFYNKLDFLYFRHIQLKNEYELRFNKKWKYNIEYKFLKSNYIPTYKEKQILIERISTRILESLQIPRYYGKQITKYEAIENIKK